mmetsp:Transcript_20178/g.50825  ORF Transcript_20178/g.50825 Transcript_20178/m.50825 type:complete len:559 (+) Transcript_20178:450-2126(+)
MEDRAVERLGHVGAVLAGAALLGVSGEGDLVVDDDVDAAADGVVGQLAHVQRLVHNALARKGAVAVDQDGHVLPLAVIAVRGVVLLRVLVGGVGVVLLGAHFAEHHRIDGLQVRGVGEQGEVDGAAVHGGPQVGGAQVVLHVAAARVVVLRGLHAAKLVEDLRQRLSHHVGQHVEAAAMGHAKCARLGTLQRQLVHQRLHARDDGLAALQPKALGGGVLVRQEGLEHLAPDEAIQDALLHLCAVLELFRQLHLLADPVALLAVCDVHVLDAGGAAVRHAHAVHHLSQRAHRALLAQETLGVPGAHVKLAVKVCLTEAVELGVQQLDLGAHGVLQRVQLRGKMPLHLVSPHEGEQLHGLLDGLVGGGRQREWVHVGGAHLPRVEGLRHRLRVHPAILHAEEGGPSAVDGGGVAAVLLLQVLEVAAAGAVQEGVLQLAQRHSLGRLRRSLAGHRRRMEATSGDQTTAPGRGAAHGPDQAGRCGIGGRGAGRGGGAAGDDGTCTGCSAFRQRGRQQRGAAQGGSGCPVTGEGERHRGGPQHRGLATTRATGGLCLGRRFSD